MNIPKIINTTTVQIIVSLAIQSNFLDDLYLAMQPT